MSKIIVLAFLLLPVSLNAHDFGLLLNQNLMLDGTGSDSNVDYEAALVPRFSMLVGDDGDLFFSASLKVVHRNNSWNFVPELLRNEFIWSFDDMDFHLGRMMYSDPMNLIAVGLFDGAMFSFHSMMGTFGAGVWYTGLLYRNRTKIAMTQADAELLATPFDWDDFAGTYFASRRFMAALFWEHPSLAEMFRLDTALIAQVDLNGEDNSFHSQYLVARASMPFGGFIFDLGGAVETGQSTNGNGTDFSVGLAGSVGVHWMPPAPFHNMLSFTGLFTSGRFDDDGSMSVFTPVTALTHGNVLRARIPGLSILSLDYMARLLHTFSAGLNVSHFVRSDRGTFTTYPLDGEPSDNYFLGTEFFGRLIWSPVSDLALNFGAGVFLPALGNVAPDADPRWRVELSVTLALY